MWARGLVARQGGGTWPDRAGVRTRDAGLLGARSRPDRHPTRPGRARSHHGRPVLASSWAGVAMSGHEAAMADVEGKAERREDDAGILAADGDALHGSEIAVGGRSFIWRRGNIGIKIPSEQHVMVMP